VAGGCVRLLPRAVVAERHLAVGQVGTSRRAANWRRMGSRRGTAALSVHGFRAQIVDGPETRFHEQAATSCGLEPQRQVSAKRWKQPDRGVGRLGPDERFRLLAPLAAHERNGDDPMARSQPDRRRDTGIAFDRALGVCLPARARLLRHGSGLPRAPSVPRSANPCQSECRIGAANRSDSLVATSRHRARKFSANDCVGAARRGLALRPPPSAEARSPRTRRSAAGGGSGRIPAAARSTCVKRSIETTRTSCSTRSTPRARTRHMMPRAPLRAHRRRRRDSHAACSRTRARWRPS